MDSQIAENILAEVLAQWDLGDNKALGKQLVVRLQLVECDPPWETYTQQVTKLVKRKLTSTEKAKLDYFYEKLCQSGSGPERI